jgi:hypothetical protein
MQHPGKATTTFICALVFLSTSSTVCAQPSPPVVMHAEDCLRANVDRVVADDADLQSAATFLVNYACAAEVSRAQNYETNLVIASQLNAMVKTMATAMPSQVAPSNEGPASQLPSIEFTATVDTETGDLIVPPAPPGPMAQMLTTMIPQTMRQAATLMSNGAIPVKLRALAGQLVISAYERNHAATTPSHRSRG